MPYVSIVIDIDRRLISISDINRWKSIKKKSCDFDINIDDFPIEIDNNFIDIDFGRTQIFRLCENDIW